MWKSCRVGINDSNVTPSRLERNLHYVLDKCVPGWKLVSIFEGDDLSVPNVEYYMLGELDDARDKFLSLYPNATWPEVDEEALAERKAAEAEVAKVKAEEAAHTKRLIETFDEVRYWAKESYAAMRLAEKSLEGAKRGGVLKQDDTKVREAQRAYNQAKAEDDQCRSKADARQRVQVQRLADGLPVYGPDEGPERLG